MVLDAHKRSRGEALAEAFFYKMDRELLANLRSRMAHAEKLKLLEAYTGLRDRQILEKLIDAGFDLSTVTAFLFAPAVFVAWADGRADQREQEAIQSTLSEKTVSKEVVAQFLSHPFFRDPPSPDLWRLWESFSISFLINFPQQDRDALVKEIIEICYLVARTSGGIWGMGSISTREAKVIQNVLEVLHRQTPIPSQVA